ncbi:MAG: 3-dehydroquinate synthase [Clostridia bacterium]
MRVELGKNSYDILINVATLDKLGEFVSSSGGKICVVTDDNVAKLYLQTVVTSLEKSGAQVCNIILPHGEKTKNFSSLLPIYSQLTAFGITRKDLLVALGGGVIGDLCGFVAATYLRGIDFVQVPTSLLAQVDSSVGGKVAVDIAEGKNLVGAFYQPKLVFVDTNVLTSLPQTFFVDGMAEIIKYACILDKELFELLESIHTREQFGERAVEIITRCCDCKRKIVESDERDNGERMKLNYGHTYGHALEKFYNYEKLTHGQAVAIGINYINNIAVKKGLMDKKDCQRIENLLLQFGLDISDSAQPSEVVKSIVSDKKNLGSNLVVIIVDKIGQSVLYNTNMEFWKI